MSLAERVCTRCGSEKPLVDLFWPRDKRCAGGYRWQCKVCANKARAASFASRGRHRPERQLEMERRLAETPFEAALAVMRVNPAALRAVRNADPVLYMAELRRARVAALDELAERGEAASERSRKAWRTRKRWSSGSSA